MPVTDRPDPVLADPVAAEARGLAQLAWTGEQSVRADKLATGFKWLGRGWIGPLPVPVVLLLVVATGSAPAASRRRIS